MRFKLVLAMIVFTVLTADARACNSPRAARGGFFARVFAAERAVVSLPVRVATAPQRLVSRTATRTRTVQTAPAPVVKAPCPPGGCPLPKKK